MGGIAVVHRGRGEDHLVGEGMKIDDRPDRRPGRHVLDDLEAGDDVVVPGKRLGDRSDPEKLPDVLARVVDRKLAEVDAISLDTSIAQGFDEQPDGAAGVERCLRMEVLDQAVGDLAEEVDPESFRS